MLTDNLIAHIRKQKMLPALANEMHEAEKFVFESSDDMNEDAVGAIFDTTQAMAALGMLRLPQPVVLIEDPINKDNLSQAKDTVATFVAFAHRAGVSRAQRRAFAKIYSRTRSTQFYLCRERPMGIEIVGMTGMMIPGYAPHFALYEVPRFLSFTAVDAAGDVGTPIFAVREFLFALATKQAVKTPAGGERVALGKGKFSEPTSRHTIVQVQARAQNGGPIARGNGPKRALHPVRGYVWGKNTRPLQDQRWIEPFYRGDAGLGVITHHHYRVPPLKSLQQEAA